MANSTNGKKSVLGKMLKLRRVQAGLTRNNLSEKTGLAPALISRIERDEYHPSEAEIRKIAKVLHIGENALLIFGYAVNGNGHSSVNKTGRFDSSHMPRHSLSRRLISLHYRKST